MHTYIQTYMRMYTYIHECMHTYTHTHTHTYTCDQPLLELLPVYQRHTRLHRR